MASEDEWDMTRNGRESFFGVAGMGVLRVTLLFGSAAVALALIVAPIADNYSRPQFADAEAGLDYMSTASIGQRGAYTIRKSVLQDMPGSLCVIRNNGQQIGDC